MPVRRKLTLKREVMQELTADELLGVNGGTRETLMSCYTFISCWVLDCLPTIENRCIQ